MKGTSQLSRRAEALAARLAERPAPRGEPLDVSVLTPTEQGELAALILAVGPGRPPTEVELDRFRFSPFAPACDPAAPCRGLSCDTCQALGGMPPGAVGRLGVLLRLARGGTFNGPSRPCWHCRPRPWEHRSGVWLACIECEKRPEIAPCPELVRADPPPPVPYTYATNNPADGPIGD